MPNKSKPHKKNRMGIVRTGRDISNGTHSVKDLLGRVTNVLTPIAKQRIQQKSWREWLDQRLDKALAERVTGVVERDDSLVIFAESAGWSTRVRYALAELETQVRERNPAIKTITVRVMPKSVKPESESP
jgi:hypothetical protein